MAQSLMAIITRLLCQWCNYRLQGQDIGMLTRLPLDPVGPDALNRLAAWLDLIASSSSERTEL
jgi:hypothetical protein